MQAQGIALRRWTCLHRREIAAGVALAAVVVTLVIAGPILLAIAAAEFKRSRRRTRLLGLAICAGLVRAAVWLWRDLRGVPHGRWHECAVCHRPIPEPSRAVFCSHKCRQLARLERDALDNDSAVAECAERRMRNMRLRAIADGDLLLGEVSF